MSKNATKETLDASIDEKKGKKSKRPRSIIKIILLSIAVVIVAAVAVVALDIFADTEMIVRPPEINLEPRPRATQGPIDSDSPDSPSTPTESLNLRTPAGLDAKYTFLILGTDDGSNTDAIMVATLDLGAETLNIVNIPRDTMVNVGWNTRKANSIYANMRHQNRNAEDRMAATMQATVERFADILGFEVDYWVMLDLRALSRLVDSVGGVNFYVPVNMNYRDTADGLHINFRRGMQHINGQQASELLRFRSFASGDLGRINVQQQFLTAAIEQIIANRDAISVTDLASIFLNYVQTNLYSPPLHLDLVWLGTQFLRRIDPENVNFITMPVHNDSVGGVSYVSILLDAWLEILNEKINPFFEDKTVEDLSILTRGPDRRLFVTDGNWAGSSNWGATSRGPASPQANTGGLHVTGGGANQGTPATPPPSGNGGTPTAPTTPNAGTVPADPPPVTNGENEDDGRSDDYLDDQTDHEPDDDYFSNPDESAEPAEAPNASEDTDIQEGLSDYISAVPEPEPPITDHANSGALPADTPGSTEVMEY
ncbi:MAG: LCP family protein [Oscillospiraceae bacterium]|nr:LCP family protein [Oscillospiraceae bacterium]